jgi:LysM domain
MFRAARSARVSNLIAGAEPTVVEQADQRRRPLARTAPILLEPPRLVDQAVRFQFDRAPGQVALIALMLVAFAVIALARLSSGGAAAGASATPAAITTAPGRSAVTTTRPAASATPVSSAAESAGSFRATYTVKKGDTLQGIAKKFSTTTARLRTANGLSSSTLKVGQVLNIP